METKKRRISDFILKATLPLVIVVIWQIVCDKGLVSPASLASPYKILETVWYQMNTGVFWNNITASFLRVLIGFFIALLLALVLGISIGLSNKVELLSKFLLQVLKPIPPIAWIPLAILWFGIGEMSKLYIIFYGAFFPILLNTVDGIKNIDKRYIELGKVYEIKYTRLVKKVILPGALPQILTGIRVGLANAWISVVAAEMIAATKGIGFMLSNGRSLSRPDWVILAMILIGIVGKIMDDVLTIIFNKLLRHKHK